ncbi:MAG TPA: RNA polymerase sigma factor SigJ [Solirubrobacterales bacterium]|nr:RNA polymerase sigma factor SigJ [Solirubrobacterales bacterium]
MAPGPGREGRRHAGEAPPPAAEGALLAELRPPVFGVAYRMLGSVAEAEDVAQEALLRLHEARERGEEIASPRAYAMTVATRLAIDELRSARARREVYVGEWLPEPLLTGTGAAGAPLSAEYGEDPAERVEMADSLSLAFLALLERLTPEQRAAFLLHDVFGYGYDEVAAVLGSSEAGARQHASRGRRLVRERRPRFEASAAQREELADRFFAAVEEGDVGELRELLASDVELHGDGGGKVPALARPVQGAERVARTIAAWAKAGSRIGGLRIERVEVNGEPGARTLSADGELINVFALEIAGGRVQAMRSVVNPDKLGHLGPLADLNALLGE